MSFKVNINYMSLIAQNMSLIAQNMSFNSTEYVPNDTEYVPKAVLQPLHIKACRVSKSLLEALEILEAHQLIN